MTSLVESHGISWDLGTIDSDSPHGSVVGVWGAFLLVSSFFVLPPTQL